nr:MAG TPA: hypothetical protein [Bacteriophage sp.]DAP79564.1 MAG TPA: hypothetical protein [Caudoviricetes sp.]
MPVSVECYREISSGNPNKSVASLIGRNPSIRSVECTSSPK